MIAANQPQLAKVHRRKAKVQAQINMVLSQNTINAVMWQIIKNDARAQAEAKDEEFDESVDTILTVPLEELATMPKTFALEVTPNAEAGTVQIKAIVQKEKGNIILPDGGKLND